MLRSMSLCALTLALNILPRVSIFAATDNLCKTLLSQIEMRTAAAERQTQRRSLIQAYNDSDLGFIAEDVPSHDTIRVYSQNGKVPDGANARLLLLHGMGWNTSDHALFREIIRVLADPKSQGTLPQAEWARRIQREANKNNSIYGVEAIDMPAHGVGANAENLVNNLDASVEYLASYIRTMKAETPHLPIVILGWSWAGPLAVELERRHPELVDALIVLATTEPGMPQRQAIDEFISFAESKYSIEGNDWHRMPQNDSVKILRNREGMTWISSVAAQVSPFQPTDFSGTPTLFLYGENDTGVNAATRRAAATIESPRFSNVVIPQGSVPLELGWQSHEPFHSFNSDQPPFSVAAYKILYEFLSRLSH